MKLKKIFLLTIGLVSVGIGIIGIALPILPTVPFLLLSGICFANTSPRLHYWLYHNRIFGTYLKNYHEGKGIPRYTKIWVISLLWVSILSSVFIFISSVKLWLRILLIMIALAVTIHILKIKTKK